MTRPCVLVFAGSDPSGGAGIQADIGSVGAMGAHALALITALTVQDNDRVQAVYPVPARWLQQQAQVLVDKIDIAAVKIGVIGNLANAAIILDVIRTLRARNPALPVVLDPVLASGHGDQLSLDNAALMLADLIPLATLLTPNLPEAAILCAGDRRAEQQVDTLLLRGCGHVLLKGGHGFDAQVVNRWYTDGASRSWSWPRLPGTFHGSGCTLASAIAGALACGLPMEVALDVAQAFCHRTLEQSFAIADGQRIPNRNVAWNQDKNKEQ
ncbi:Phosphomethylpyrimidine kinase [Oxalobacteraceae bacterium IMCC9480]|nr:Phosphomethylpyrimidine kinase [Oxalobacteraceae bacterium IMCC9480]NDP57802.1 hydroxymethylpyrimidine/phosphomethylpyrimidine kinase [Oxalobacteraceae bacterium]